MPSRDSFQSGGRPIPDSSHKWVISLSSKPLTHAQRFLLVKGPNYAIAPRHTPNLEYITAIESLCPELGQQDALEHWANKNRVLRYSHPPRSNLSIQKHRL